MRQIEKIDKLVDSLIIEGVELLETKWADKQYELIGLVNYYVDLEKYHKWIGGFRLLLSIMGDFADPWKDILETNKNSNKLESAASVLGSLRAIKDGLDKGLIIKFEDLGIKRNMQFSICRGLC